MLWLTRWFGVTGSDSERDLAREPSDIEEIVRRTLEVQATMLLPNNTGRWPVEHMRKGSAPGPSSKSLTLRPDATLSWQRGSPRGYLPSPAYIPRLCVGEILIRRRTLTLSPMFDRCHSPSTSRRVAWLFPAGTVDGRIFHCKMPPLCPSTTPLDLRRS